MRSLVLHAPSGVCTTHCPKYQRFTSAGEANVWETFTLSDIADNMMFITAVEGPTFASDPDYPALRVADFQLLGELIETPGILRVREPVPHFVSKPETSDFSTLVILTLERAAKIGAKLTGRASNWLRQLLSQRR